MGVERIWSKTTREHEEENNHDATTGSNNKEPIEWKPSDPDLNHEWVALQPGNYKPREDLTPYKGRNFTPSELNNYKLPVPLGIGEENAVVHVYPQGTIEVHGKVYAWNKLVKPGIYSRYDKLRYLETNVEIKDRQVNDDYKHHAAYNRTIRVPNKWVKKTNKHSRQAILEYTFVEFNEQIKTEQDGVMYPIPVLNGKLTLYPDGTFKTEGVVVDSANTELMDDYGYLGDHDNYTNYPTFINDITKDDINPKNVYHLISENEDGSVTYGAIDANKHVHFSDYPKLPDGIIPINNGSVTVNPIGELLITGSVITDKGYPIKEGRYKNVGELLIGWKLKRSMIQAVYERENEDYIDKSIIYNPVLELGVKPRVTDVDNSAMLFVQHANPKLHRRLYRYQYQNDRYHLIDIPELNGKAVRYEAMKGWDNFASTEVSETVAVKRNEQFKYWLENNHPEVYKQFYDEKHHYIGEGMESYPLMKSTRIQLGNKYLYPQYRFNPLGRLAQYVTYDHTDFYTPEGLTLNDINDETYGTPVKDTEGNLLPREAYFNLKTVSGKDVFFIPYSVNPFGSEYYGSNHLENGKRRYESAHGEVRFSKVEDKVFVHITPPCILKYGDRYFTLEAGKVRIDNLHDNWLEGKLDSVNGYLDNGPLYFRKKRVQQPIKVTHEDGSESWQYLERQVEDTVNHMDENHKDDQDGLTFREDKGLMTYLRRDITAYLTTYEKTLLENTLFLTPYHDVVDGKVIPYRAQAVGVSYRSEDIGLMLTYYGFRYNEVFPLSWNISGFLFGTYQSDTAVEGSETLLRYSSVRHLFYYNRDQEYMTLYRGLAINVGPTLFTDRLDYWGVKTVSDKPYTSFNDSATLSNFKRWFKPVNKNTVLVTTAGSTPQGFENDTYHAKSSIRRQQFENPSQQKTRTLFTGIENGFYLATRLNKDNVLMYWAPQALEYRNTLGRLLRPDGVTNVDRPYWILSRQSLFRFQVYLENILPPNFKLYYRINTDINVYSGEIPIAQDDKLTNLSPDRERLFGHPTTSKRTLHRDTILPHVPKDIKKGYIDVFLDNPFDEDQRIYQQTEDNGEPLKPVVSPMSYRVYFRVDETMKDIVLRIPDTYPDKPITNRDDVIGLSVEPNSWVYLQDITEYPERLITTNGTTVPVTYLFKKRSNDLGSVSFTELTLIPGHRYRVRVIDSFGVTNYYDFTVEQYRYKYGDKLSSRDLFGLNEYVYPVHAKPDFYNLILGMSNSPTEYLSIETMIAFDVETQQYQLQGLWMTESGKLMEEGVYTIGETPPHYQAHLFDTALFQKHKSQKEIKPLSYYRGKPAYLISENGSSPPVTQTLKPTSMMVDLTEGREDAAWLVSPTWRYQLTEDKPNLRNLLESRVNLQVADPYTLLKFDLIVESLLRLGKDSRVKITVPEDSYGNTYRELIGRHHEQLILPPYFCFTLIDGTVLYHRQDMISPITQRREYVGVAEFIGYLRTTPGWVAGLSQSRMGNDQVGYVATNGKPDALLPMRYVPITDIIEARYYQPLSPRWFLPTLVNMTDETPYYWVQNGERHQIKTTNRNTTYYQLSNWTRILTDEEVGTNQYMVYYATDYRYELRKRYLLQVDENNGMKEKVYRNWVEKGFNPNDFQFDDKTLGWVEYHSDGNKITLHGRVKHQGKYTKNKTQSITSVGEIEYLDFCLDSIYTLYDEKPNQQPVLNADDSITLEKGKTWLYNQVNPCHQGEVIEPMTYRLFSGELRKVDITTADGQPTHRHQRLIYKFTFSNITEDEVNHLIVVRHDRYQLQENNFRLLEVNGQDESFATFLFYMGNNPLTRFDNTRNIISKPMTIDVPWIYQYTDEAGLRKGTVVLKVENADIPQGQFPVVFVPPIGTYGPLTQTYPYGPRTFMQEANDIRGRSSLANRPITALWYFSGGIDLPIQKKTTYGVSGFTFAGRGVKIGSEHFLHHDKL